VIRLIFFFPRTIGHTPSFFASICLLTLCAPFLFCLVPRAVSLGVLGFLFSFAFRALISPFDHTSHDSSHHFKAAHRPPPKSERQHLGFSMSVSHPWSFPPPVAFYRDWGVSVPFSLVVRKCLSRLTGYAIINHLLATNLVLLPSYFPFVVFVPSATFKTMYATLALQLIFLVVRKWSPPFFLFPDLRIGTSLDQNLLFCLEHPKLRLFIDP